jgi:hypothetical protein
LLPPTSKPIRIIVRSRADLLLAPISWTDAGRHHRSERDCRASRSAAGSSGGQRT